MNEKKEKNTSKARKVLCFLGGVALAGGMCIVMPKLIRIGSDHRYKNSNPSVKHDDDDWGPEIVKREKPEEQDGEV